MVGDRGHVDAKPFLLQHQEGTSDRKAADMASAEATADDDVLGRLPLLELEKSSRYRREFPGELLDGRVHEPRGQRVLAVEILVQLRFRQLPGRRVTERVRAVLADVLARLIEDAPERALVRAVAEEPGLVLELLIVGVDDDARQHVPPVLDDGGEPGLPCLGHCLTRLPRPNVGAAGCCLWFSCAAAAGCGCAEW